MTRKKAVEPTKKSTVNAKSNEIVEKVLQEPLTKVMGERFGRYSKYIIQDRALPDVRDGLKPVQRRILYGMFVEGNRQDKAYRKSAKAVGNIMGNYHPHGDSSIYDAMVRMSQDWKTSLLLIDMHGNNGSIDGDGPAAMRYTESRLTSISEELLTDINKNTVDMAYNFDDSEVEPTVLPASYPNLLMNGATGISAGYATDIPPHNFKEIMDATILLLDKPNSKLEDIMKIVKGPDFPTGGIVQGIDGIKNAFETGKGKVFVRSKFEIEELRGGKEQIVITEIPYEVVKTKIVTKIDEIRADKKVDGIVEVRDESGREGLRIVIELKKDAPTELITNYLLKNTDMQVSYNYNMVCIVDRTPKQLGIIDIINAFNKHRKEVVTRRTTFELEKANKRLHIVEGLIKALSVLDDVVKTIKGSKNKSDAKNNIQDVFGFSAEQSEAIVSLQLYRLTNTDIKELENESKELQKEVKSKELLLSSETRLKTFMKKEYEVLMEKYNEPRRTLIQNEIEEIKVDNTQLIVEEDVVVSVSKDGYIKRSTTRSVNSSGGIEACGIKEDDTLVHIGEAKTTQILLAFTNKGNYVYLPIHSLQEDKWKDNGTHINHYVSGGGSETILFATVLDNLDGDKYVTIIKNSGLIKRTLLKEYEVQRFGKLYNAIKTTDDELVTSISITEGANSILIYSKLGYGLVFKEEEVNATGIKTNGMKAIDLREGDEVEKSFIANTKEVAKLLKEHGELPEYPRGRKGNKVKLPKTRK